jgi:hypothetical protein
LAAALASRAGLLLLDERTAVLDPLMAATLPRTRQRRAARGPRHPAVRSPAGRARGAGRPGDGHPQWKAGRDRHASGRPHVLHARPPRRAGQSRGQRRARDAHVPPERPPGRTRRETPSPAGTTSGTPTVGTQAGIPGSTLAGYHRCCARCPPGSGRWCCGITPICPKRKSPRPWESVRALQGPRRPGQRLPPGTAQLTKPGPARCPAQPSARAPTPPNPSRASRTCRATAMLTRSNACPAAQRSPRTPALPSQGRVQSAPRHLRTGHRPRQNAARPASPRPTPKRASRLQSDITPQCRDPAHLPASIGTFYPPRAPALVPRDNRYSARLKSYMPITSVGIPIRRSAARCHHFPRHAP